MSGSTINIRIQRPVLIDQRMDPSHVIEFKLPEDISSSKWSPTLLPTSRWDLMLLPCYPRTLCTLPTPYLPHCIIIFDFCLFT